MDCKLLQVLKKVFIIIPFLKFKLKKTAWIPNELLLYNIIFVFLAIRTYQLFSNADVKTNTFWYFFFVSYILIIIYTE